MSSSGEGRENTLESAMRRALELAAGGPAFGANPQVGCVILSAEGTVLAEGWHRGCGTPHAEVDALSHLTPEQSRGATAVVTLEPCNHNGHTGPCSEALIEAGITTVVFGVTDPNPSARGGAVRLREAGVSVAEGLLAEPIGEAMHSWLTAITLGRPYVTLKWASTLDGRVAAADGTSQWITGEQSRRHAHDVRAQSDAIIVGTGTVMADNPSLTARDSSGGLLPHQPVPVVIGERPIPGDARVLSHPEPVFVTGNRDLTAALDELYSRGMRHVLVEGGPTLASAFIAAGLVDEYLVYQAPALLGEGRTAISGIGVTTLADAQRLHIHSVHTLGDDVLLVARSTHMAGANPTNSARTTERRGSDVHRNH